MNDLQTQALKRALGRFATGVVIITGIKDGVPSGLTCQSFVSVSLDPPLVAISPGRQSRSWPAIAESGAFCVNVASSGQRPTINYFARSGADKFSGVAWQPTESTGSPMIADCVAWIDCRIERSMEVGDHYLVIGHVVDHRVREGNPLLYYRSRYHDLGGSHEGDSPASVASLPY